MASQEANKTGDCQTQPTEYISAQTQANSYKYSLFRNVHERLAPPEPGATYLTKGDFAYFHYGCDGLNDNGWGCAYRSMQSMCSWILTKRQQAATPPSIHEIQATLVRLGDKPKKFIGSRDWIGSMEICYVIDSLYDVACKVIHSPKSGNLKELTTELCEYFQKIGGFVMMGGDVDTGSNGIAGIHVTKDKVYLLVIDPHFSGVPKSVEKLIERRYIRWQDTTEFVATSFYNLCLPQLK